MDSTPHVFSEKSMCFFPTKKRTHRMKAPFKGPWSLVTQFSTTDGGRNLKLQGWMLGSPKISASAVQVVFYPKGHQLLVVEISKNLFICCQQRSELLLVVVVFVCLFDKDVCLKWILSFFKWAKDTLEALKAIDEAQDILLCESAWLGIGSSTRVDGIGILLALFFIEDSKLGKGTPSIQGGPRTSFK